MGSDNRYHRKFNIFCDHTVKNKSVLKIKDTFCPIFNSHNLICKKYYVIKTHKIIKIKRNI